MNTYGWLLLGQTVAALGALALAGGWALVPFRRDERPFLGLAAPLAGLFTLGGATAALYFLVGLPFDWCLWVALALNAAVTVACLIRTRPSLPVPQHRAVAAAVALAGAYWGTVSCNKSSIDAREPALASMDGSDMFGYAITADWLRAHPAGRPPRPTEPLEVMIHVNLVTDGGRPVAFVLAAAAAEARGTTVLFAYDWASGVILAAGLLGFGGVFARNSLALVLLVAGVGTSNWLANARSGYFARSLAYPGTMLLAGLLLSGGGQFTRRQAGALAVLGAAVGFALAPVFPAVVLGMVAGCYVAALVLVYPLKRWREDGAAFKADVLKPALAAVAVCLATVLPAFAAHYAGRERIGVPGAPAVWKVVIPVSLDLEPPALPLLKPLTEKRLLYGVAALLAAFAGAALAYRRSAALALLLCVAVVPLSYLLKQNLLHAFQGIVYPLTLAGAGLLLAPPVLPRRAASGCCAACGTPVRAPLPAGAWRRPVRAAALAGLVLAFVGLHVPPIRATADRYLYSAQPYKVVVRQSDAAAIRAITGDEPVDVALGHFADNHVVLSELAAHGVPVRFRSPGWERSLGNWAREVGCPEPDLLVPKSRFALVERNAYAPPGTERYVGRRLKLIEDRDAVTVLGVEGSQEMIWDLEMRPGVWIGNTPTTFLIHNGTGREQAVKLLGNTSAGPSHPDRDRRTLVYRLNEQTGKQSLPTENQAAVPLVLAPGLNRVELSVEEPASPAPPRGAPVALLAFCAWRLEAAP